MTAFLPHKRLMIDLARHSWLHIEFSLHKVIETAKLRKVWPLQALTLDGLRRRLLGAWRAGTGSFGRVRLVRCNATGQYLALKAIKKADILRMHQVQHIANEKDILGSLHHPFIVDLCALTHRARAALNARRIGNCLPQIRCLACP